LKNYVSYWLVISTLIETSQIDELDSLIMETLDDSDEVFFIYENSLKLLFKYLRKLSTWYNEVIYLFYF